MNKEADSSNTAPVKVVHLISALHAGGIERLLLAMAPYWNQNRFSIEVWCLNIDSIQTYVDWLHARGVRVQMIGRKKREKVEAMLLFRLLLKLHQEKVCIIHSHTPYPLVVSLIIRLLHKPRVLHFHHQHSLPSKKQINLIDFIFKIRQPNCFISVSSSLANETRKYFKNISCDYEIIHNGIEIDKTKYSNCQSQLSHIFTSVRLVPVKNVELLLLAMQKVKERCPAAKLSILGSGDLLDTLQEKSKLLGIHSSVNFLGYVLEPEKYYRQFGIFVLPSLYESFGLALLEAMAWGKACISTDVGGTMEFLHHEQNGLSVPSNNPEALAEAIIRLINNPNLALEFGKEARKTALSLNIKNTVQQIQQLYTRYLH